MVNHQRRMFTSHVGTSYHRREAQTWKRKNSCSLEARTLIKSTKFAVRNCSGYVMLLIYSLHLKSWMNGIFFKTRQRKFFLFLCYCKLSCKKREKWIMHIVSLSTLLQFFYVSTNEIWQVFYLLKTSRTCLWNFLHITFSTLKELNNVSWDQTPTYSHEQELFLQVC